MTELLIEGQYKQKQVFLGLCVGGASQMALVIKNLPANAGGIRDIGLILGLGRLPWRRAWQPTPVFLPEESHGQKSLTGYSPSGHKKLDMTEGT